MVNVNGKRAEIWMAQATETLRRAAIASALIAAFAASGCASYGVQIATTQAQMDTERLLVQQNNAEIMRLRAWVAEEERRRSYLDSANGRRDFYDGQCHRVPVAKPALTLRPEQSCKTDNETHVHAVNQCVNPGNCEYVGALYALGRLPLEYQYVLNSGCPFKPEDKTFMEEYVGMASVPLCNLTLNPKEGKKKKKSKLNKLLKFNWSGVVLDVALAVACNVKQDPYQEQYSEVTQCLARESSDCNQRYTQWQNQNNRDLFGFETRQREADRDFATCKRELEKLDYQGGDIRLQIVQAIDQHEARIDELQAVNTSAQQRIVALAQSVAKLSSAKADGEKPRRAIEVFY